jgi:hypothetical protein
MVDKPHHAINADKWYEGFVGWGGLQRLLLGGLSPYCSAALPIEMLKMIVFDIILVNLASTIS